MRSVTSGCNSIWVRSKEAYFKCIEKGSALTLEEAIEIAQIQDAIAHQVGYMRATGKGDQLQMEVYQLQGNRQSGAKWNMQQCGKEGHYGSAGVCFQMEEKTCTCQ